MKNERTLEILKSGRLAIHIRCTGPGKSSHRNREIEDTSQKGTVPTVCGSVRSSSQELLDVVARLSANSSWSPLHENGAPYRNRVALVDDGREHSITDTKAFQMSL